MRLIIFILLSLFYTSCTKVAVTVANIPSAFSSNTVLRDISYGHDAWQKLDLYFPSNAHNHSLPVVIFFYGGRWSSGSKEMYAFIGDKFANRGYMTLIVDYSKYPHVRFPSFVEDGAKAVAWTFDHIKEYGGNPDKIYLLGHSAGAHIGALLIADEHYLNALGKQPSVIKAFAGLAGPYAFTPDDEHLKTIFGPPETYYKMQVPTFIQGDEPPMLLLWGDADSVVWKQNIDLLSQQIKNKNGSVEVIIYKDLDHIELISQLAWFSEIKAPVFEDVTTFFQKY